MAKATTEGFDQILRFHPRRGVELDPNGGRLGVRVQILEADQMGGFRERRGWAGVTLDDGRILAACLVATTLDEQCRLEDMPDPLDCYGGEEAEDPDWADDAREVRGLLLDLFERHPKVRWLAMRAGGNGTASFDVGYGKAGLTLAFGRDPSS